MTDTPMKETKEKVAAAAKGAKKDAMAMANFEMPAAFREYAEKGVQQARDTYKSYKSIAEDATDALEDSFASVTKGTTELQAHALGVAKSNVNAGFELVERMIGVKSLAEALEIQTDFARRQFDTLATQTREFQAIVTKVQADSAKPFKDGVSKAMSQFKQAS